MLILKTCLQINRVCKSQNVVPSVCWEYWAGDTSLKCLFLFNPSYFFLLSPAFQNNERSWNPPCDRFFIVPVPLLPLALA